MTDRRRINGPAGGTTAPTFVQSDTKKSAARGSRSRKPNELRKIFLQTGLIPSATGSAYLELENAPTSTRQLAPSSSTIKLSCAVHGPKPLPRNAAFSPNLQLTASVKFAPFATHVRKGYVPDFVERDLGLHLENALKGVILPDRWPKSAVEISVTVLEAESLAGIDAQADNLGSLKNLGLMNILAGCINVSAAALADARIDCVDLLAGGVAAVVPDASGQPAHILDPCPAEHGGVHAACLIGYLPSRDEITEVWNHGSAEVIANSQGVEGFQQTLDFAVMAAKGAQSVLKEVLVESVSRELQIGSSKGKSKVIGNDSNDIEMRT